MLASCRTVISAGKPTNQNCYALCVPCKNELTRFRFHSFQREVIRSPPDKPVHQSAKAAAEVNFACLVCTSWLRLILSSNNANRLCHDPSNPWTGDNCEGKTMKSVTGFKSTVKRSIKRLLAGAPTAIPAPKVETVSNTDYWTDY